MHRGNRNSWHCSIGEIHQLRALELVQHSDSLGDAAKHYTAHGPTAVTTSISSEKRYMYDLPQHTKTMAEILLQSPSQAPTTNCTWRDQLECGYLETLPGVQEYVPDTWDQGAMKSRLGSKATEEIAVVQRSHHLLYTSQKKSQISKSSRPQSSQ